MTSGSTYIDAYNYVMVSFVDYLYTGQYSVNMPKIQLSPGTAHQIPPDLTKALKANIEVSMIWNKLTPIQRNEWVCWVVSVKKESTRKEHIDRVIRQLQEGKRRPCCWIGCIHRTDKEISPSIKYYLNKRDKTKQT